MEFALLGLTYVEPITPTPFFLEISPFWNGDVYPMLPNHCIFFFLHPWHAEVTRPRIKPSPQQ